MNRKQRNTLKVFENVSVKYPETKKFVQDNMKGVCEREHTTVEEVIYFVVFV